MIGASKRQRDKLTADGQLEQHLHLAKRFFWQRQLFHCALTALAASLLAYLLALPFGWHALLVCVGFVAGFLWMNRDGLKRALRYIEDGIGLSYSTALEHASTRDKPDDSAKHESANNQTSDWQEALYQSVLQRAHYRIRRLEAPKLQPWWLPLVAVALMLLIVPDVNWAGSRVTPSESARQTRPLASSADEAANPAPRQDANPQPDGERSPADANSATTEDGDEAAPAQDSADDGEDSASPASERDALSRFVDNLSEGSSATANDSDNANPADANPAGERQQPQTGGSATPRAGDQDFRQVPPDDRSRDAQSADTPPASGAGQQRSQGSQEGQEQGQSGESGAQSGEGEQRVNSGESPDDGSQGESQAESGDPQTGDQAGDDPQAGSQSQPQTSPNAPPEEAGEGQTGSAQAGDQQGAGEGSEDALSEPSNGAGGQGGFSEDNSEELSNMSSPEQLEGLLEQGTINTGGQVRLPGDDDVMLPAGSAPEAYQQGVERALSEGRIPVEYQEILRSYFR